MKVSQSRSGAAKSKWMYKQFNLPIITCQKNRCPKTGQLSEPSCNEEIPEGKGLIIDDICDGGGTFLQLKNTVFKNTPLALYTTHGIYSKGFKKLNRNFEKLYCSDSYRFGFNSFPLEWQDDAQEKLHLISPIGLCY